MNIKLRRKWLRYGPDKPGKPGGTRGHGSYKTRAGNSHVGGRTMPKGAKHPIGMSGRTLATNAKR